MKYAWIRDNSLTYPISLMCAKLNVSRNGYYSWLKSKKKPKDEMLPHLIKLAFDEFREYLKANGMILEHERQG